MSNSMAVIGDVHGQYDQLVRLVDSLDPNNHHVVFVGDLIDRGPKSYEVLEFACKMKADWPAGMTVLRGNHEQALLEFLQSGNPAMFLRNGGLATVASYQRRPKPNALRTFHETFPSQHLELLRESRTHLEDGDVLISHMGYNPKAPHARDLQNMVLEPHFDLFKTTANTGPPLTICGHYARRDQRVFDAGHLLCIDTGCGTLRDAPLSAVLLPERTTIQVRP